MTPLQWTEEDGLELCTEEWSGAARNVFGVFTFVLQFLIPSLVSGEIAIMCSLEFLNMDINTFGMSLHYYSFALY